MKTRILVDSNGMDILMEKDDALLQKYEIFIVQQ